MFVNELLACIHFLQVEWICLGYLWDNGVLEVYGMVKGSPREEFSCFEFIKYLGILGILQGKLLSNLFSSLSQRCGKSELANRGLVFSKDLLTDCSQLLLLTDSCSELKVMLLASSQVFKKILLLDHFRFIMSGDGSPHEVDSPLCYSIGGPPCLFLQPLSIDGIVTVRGLDLIFPIIHLSPLVSDSPFTFTVVTMFLSDIYQYTIWKTPFVSSCSTFPYFCLY